MQQHDLKETLESLKSNFNSKPSQGKENMLIQEEFNKDCAINVVSEIEEALSKQSVYDELPFEINIQQYFDVPNMESNVLCYEQLVMAETCKNELDVSKYFPMVNLVRSLEVVLEGGE